MPLHVAEDIHYACTGCGRSCRDFDEVSIDVVTAYRIRSLPLFNPRLAEGGDGLPHRPSYMSQSQLLPGAFTLAKVDHVDGGERCVFLDQDCRCALHLAHGPEVKPPTCRVFPFLFSRTPDGIHAGVSFACTAVLQDHGPPLARQRGELGVAAELAADIPELGAQVFLRPRRPVPWSAYRELEGELLARLTHAAGVARGLAAAALCLGFADGRPSSRLRDRVLAWMCELQRALVAGHPGPALVRTATMLPEIEHHRRVPLEPMGGSEASLLIRYLRHRIARNDLLRWADLELSFGVMVIEVGLIGAYSVAIAGAEPVAVGHVAEAIRAVEQRFVVHSAFREQVQADQAALVTLRRVVAAPRFLSSFLAPDTRA